MSLALYRKYRPGTFAEVKGQEHVTEPLRQALRSGRVNHAYLFSGPRGCGKTSSARILARSLNCEQGPTPDPCGVCESCVALAPTGPGHLDVIEIDAASHGGVDDARDLRERAFFAPVSARFKIYIIDEAHMVTREGFNALLKLVEEPPPHLKFVFATTEPEKVIGTIKSRTHHYPFRLMPPATLRALMEEILESEAVPYEPTALPLVVRAGAGSARDSLSILDQLLAGADDAGITYQRAVSLLGYTDGDLLDEIVDAFARRDGGHVFHAVNRVVEGGHDPRRFATDLLERFRDLVILANVPEAVSNGLLDRPADELERLQAQAASMGPAELTRAAEVFNAGLTEMRGATSPRLLLELMCARLLLPGATYDESSLLARLERLEREGPRISSGTANASLPTTANVSSPPQGGNSPTPQGGPMTRAGAQPPSPPRPSAGDSSIAGPSAAGPSIAGSSATASASSEGPVGAASPSVPSPPTSSPVSSGARESARPASGGDDDWPAVAGVRGGAPERSSGTGGPSAAGGSAASLGATTSSGATASPSGGMSVVMQAWPSVLEAVKSRQRVAWMILNAQGRLLGAEGNLVTVGFEKPGDVQGFLKGKRDEVVAAALSDVLGGSWRVEIVVGSGPTGPSSRTSGGPSTGGPSTSSPSHGGGPAGRAPTGHGSTGPSPADPAPTSAQWNTGAQAGSSTSLAGDPGPEAQSHGQETSAGANLARSLNGTGEAAQGAPGIQEVSGTTHSSLPGTPEETHPTPTTTATSPASTTSPANGSQNGSTTSSRNGSANGSRNGSGNGSGRRTGTESQASGAQTTDESWPDAPWDEDDGEAPMPSAPRTAPRSAPSAGMAAAKSAARAAAQAGPRQSWPDAVPTRKKSATSDVDDVDPLNDANADTDELSGLALIQRELGGRIIQEIDHSQA
ncbi:DNA polymerase III subunit gamma and tau [Acrocarpospora catenulata]|uniref:DNA polymerase III subunit gamma and tau n=1 Tax=Acrocarpospora catenulata TaxID=2836182 RepID=UPI0020239C7D|nr:DNA polymerase III subunit gamma and tau [Acrocarpospora catenulata]